MLEFLVFRVYGQHYAIVLEPDSEFTGGEEVFGIAAYYETPLASVIQRLLVEAYQRGIYEILGIDDLLAQCRRRRAIEREA